MTGPPAAGQRQRGPAQPGRPAGSSGPGHPRSVWRPVFFLLATVGIVAGVAWALIGSRFLVVRSVQVTGTSALVPRSEVLAAAAVPRGLPLIRVDTGVVARRVERIRQVQIAHVSRGWPDAVTIRVVPRTPLFAVPADGRYDLVDAFGVVVTQASAQAGKPLLQAGSPAAAPAALRGSPAVRAAASVLHEVPRWVARRVTSVSAPAPGDVSLRLTGGVVISWGDPGHAARKSRELTLLVRTHASRYDVSGAGVASTQG